jgi:hypothetical protein
MLDGVGEIEKAMRRAGKGYVLGRAGQPPAPVMGQTTADRRDDIRSCLRARPFVMETRIG